MRKRQLEKTAKLIGLKEEWVAYIPPHLSFLNSD
jgi:hypothetical protein